jgi:hypothetical protein
MRVTSSIGKKFVAANLPTGHQIYFAVRTEGENNEVKSLLESRGEGFREISGVQGDKTVGRNLFELMTFGRKVPVQISTLLASTVHTDVIDAAFERYQSLGQNPFISPFIIARTEPRRWVEKLVEFFKPGIRRKIDQSLIDDSRCIILTVWDHGFDFVSDKVSRRELEQVAEQVATEVNLRLSISEDPISADLGVQNLLRQDHNPL